MASFRTEQFGDEKFCISMEESVDSVDYCRELAKQRNAEVGGGGSDCIHAKLFTTCFLLGIFCGNWRFKFGCNR